MVCGQKGRSFQGCFFGAYFDQEVDGKVRVLQSVGDVLWGPAKKVVIIVECFLAVFGEFERLGVSERFWCF